jgi:hypothetical protein
VVVVRLLTGAPDVDVAVEVVLAQPVVDTKSKVTAIIIPIDLSRFSPKSM